MAKGVRKTIILNENNPKEKLILDELGKQYNYSEFIKDALFSYIKNNNNLHDDNLMINELSHNDNKMVMQLPLNDNSMTIQLPHDDKSNFMIDLDNIDDKDAKINTSTDEDPSKNALDFLRNSF